MAYVEVKAKTVELAVEAAMRELGLSDRDRLDIKVLQEPERGFLGFGGQDAIVRVEERRSEGGGRNRRSRGGKGRQESRAGGNGGGQANRTQNQPKAAPAERGGGSGGSAPRSPDRRGSGGNRGQQQQHGRGERGGDRPRPAKVDDRDTLGTTIQEPLVKEFLVGLVGAFGLEGSVETRIEDDVIIANVVGEQTEALVGARGSVMEAVHELTKTVLQRTAADSARVRIDIAGYAERRRQALTIYAGDLITQVLEDGGELMLEPMSAADRKVIHDAVAARAGVRSYSEGEAPGRYVVIAATEPVINEEESE